MNPAIERTRSNPKWGCAWAAIAFAMVLTRRPDQLAMPQFYAEDGTMFFAQAQATPLASLLLPVGGYLNLVPRLLALIATPLPWEWQPLAFSLLAALLMTAVALRVWLAEIPRVAAGVGAAAIFAVPSAGEPFLNLCCSHFILSAVILVNLLEPPPAGRRAMVRRGAEMMLAALSGPEVIVLLPLSLWTAWRWRRPVAWLVSIPWCAAAVQMAMVAGQRNVSLEHVVPPFVLVAMYGRTLFAHGWNLGLEAAWALVAVVVAGTGVLAWRNRYLPHALLLVAIALGFLIAARTLTVGWPNPMGNGSRYAWAPFVCVVWAVGWLLAGAAGRLRQTIAAVLLALIAISAASQWIGRPPEDHRWREQVAEARAGIRTVFRVPWGGGETMEFKVPR